MFSTIIHTGADGTQEMYHGYLLETHEDYFVFGFRINCKNYKWECRNDYWELRI